jgi:lantibiotic modifying enzyme
VRAVPRLFDVLSGRPDLVATIGGGALHGFGGIAYALARLGHLLDDAEVAGWTGTAVDLAGAATEAARPGTADATSWAAGSAGALAAMVSVQRQTGLAPAARVARMCAEHLVADGPQPAGPTGFATGTAGVCWALTTYARTVPEDRRYTDAAEAVFAHLVEWTSGSGSTRPATNRGELAGLRDAGRERPPSPAWCNGDAGLALVLAQRGHPATRELVDRLATTPVRADLSLCHGELGTAEALLSLSTLDVSPVPAPRRRASLVVDTVQWHGRGCGTPGAVETPGFLSGLAGIGYGLLRLARPDQVPSALLLHPTDSPSHEGRSS